MLKNAFLVLTYCCTAARLDTLDTAVHCRVLASAISPQFILGKPKVEEDTQDALIMVVQKPELDRIIYIGPTAQRHPPDLYLNTELVCGVLLIPTLKSVYRTFFPPVRKSYL